MTLIVKQGEVINTESTSLAVGGQVKVGGNLNNSGVIKVFENGKLEVNKDLLNTGSLIINDPEKIRQLLIEVVKTSGNVAEIGSKILEIFFGQRRI